MFQEMMVNSGGGGTSPVLLWEGDGTLPTTITLSKPVTDYTHLIVYFSTGEAYKQSWGIVDVNAELPMYFGTVLASGGNKYVVGRKLSFSGTTVTVEQTSYEYGTDGTGGSWVNNGYAIPLKIYGVNIA